MPTEQLDTCERRPRLEIEPGNYSTIYAVGDVHGCLEPLLALEETIRDDASLREGRKLIVMLGDYVDRGPQSAAVLYHLNATPPAGFDRICLRGNHDDAFLDYLEGDPAGDWFLDHGAENTLRSYGVDLEAHGAFTASNFALRQAVRAAVPPAHVEFLQSMPVLVTVGPEVFVHAGIRPGRPLDEQVDDDLLWIRRSFIDLGPGLPVRVFHGHTPMREAFVGPGRVSLDTHCYKSGRLTAARLAKGEVEILSVG
ncbi:metallophosphoesterase family protein [Rhizobium wuzhouense]|uniref:Serine/threonine protein phosphatase n=1 Tax=Rhizobium wuzhouense TaxID=1986026 RepID=A0ABX5NR98_9HYPH|nr:metallophosphoesterase family protein [Rhizobium wuzhouense]PYB73402.1 serine/threonine protein phosphatase [Rhizobium wuzhouense]